MQTHGTPVGGACHVLDKAEAKNVCATVRACACVLCVCRGPAFLSMCVYVLCVCRTVRVRKSRGGCAYHGIVSHVIATYVVYMPHSPSKERESPHVGIMKEHDPPTLFVIYFWSWAHGVGLWLLLRYNVRDRPSPLSD